MKRKRTLRDYERLGALYKALNDPLNRLYIETSRLVGKTAPETRMVKKAISLVGKVRSDLEDRLFRELPHQARIDIFYGPIDTELRTDLEKRDIEREEVIG